MRKRWMSQSTTGETKLVLQLHPSRAESARDLGGLETTMQSLALDKRSPIALEIAATPHDRAFLLRATQSVTLQHLASQVQARYPQAHITTPLNDPLRLEAGEACSVLELLPGADIALPLRTFRAQDLLHEGVDPLLGILSAFNHLPANARAIAQLALIPAIPTWSRKLVVQHSSENDQLRRRERSESHAPSMGQIAILFILVILLVLITHVRAMLLPPWIMRAGISLMHGDMPVLSPGEFALAGVVGLGMLVFLACGVAFSTHLTTWITPSRYLDQRLIADKTMRPAYRVRLRFFVIGPDVARPLINGQQVTYRYVIRLWLSAFLHSSILIFRRIGFLISANAKMLRLTLRSPRIIRQCAKSMCSWSTAGQMRPHTQWVSIGGDWRQAYEVLHLWQKECRVHTQERQVVLRMLTAAYGQYHTASGGYFNPSLLSEHKARRLLATKRTWLSYRVPGWSSDVARSSHYLSVADLAALWHLPQAQDLANLAYVEQATARTLLAPAVLTTGSGHRLGHSSHAGTAVPVFFPYTCLRQNILAVASTGKGKSSLLLHLAHAQITARLNGRLSGGLMQIDFHGDLHRLTLACIPPALEDAVVQIDLSEQVRLIGFNPLDVSRGADRDKLVDNLITLIEAIWSNSYGPRTENVVEYACKTLVEANLTLVARDPVRGPDEQYTLLDVVPLVRDHSFRHAILEQVQDPYIHTWWDQYFEHNDARQQNEYTSSVVTKFSKFASSHVARRILGQPRSTISLSELIDQEKILLINCASGEIGADLAAFVGAILLGFFHMALAEQARLHPEERRHFLVLIDEFQALTGVDYQTMLAELRKYGGSFVLATQSLAYLDRLDRSLRATVLANIDHLFAFAMSAEDAYLLRLNGVEPEDIVNLPTYTCYVRLLLQGQRLPLFSLQLDDPAQLPVFANMTRQEQDEWTAHISLRSHLRYARPVGEIDDLLRSIQAREALMMKPLKGKPKPPEEELDRSQSTSPTRGTRKRGGGRGQSRTSTEASTASLTTTPLLHDLFAEEQPEENDAEEQEEGHE